MIEEIAKQLELSSTEATIYYALLKGGSITTGTISKETKHRTSTIYHVLEKLLTKGLASFVYVGKIKYYQATSPEAHLKYLEEKKESFKEFIPKLIKIQKPISKKSAKVYEGIKGLKTIFNEILTELKKGEEYYFFQVPIPIQQIKSFSIFTRTHHLNRSDKGIKAKGLVLEDSKKQVTEMFKDIKHTQIRFVKSFIPFGLIIYKNKTITIDWDEEPTAYVIESNNVANNYKLFFEERWNESKNPLI